MRPYALVGGRTRAGEAPPLPVEAVVLTEPGLDTAGVVLESAAILRMCRQPQSVAEVSARLGVPVGVARVLVADLAAQGFVRVDLPLDTSDEGGMDRALLERVLAGLEAL